MKHTPKYKAMWKGEEYTITAMHLLDNPYIMLESKDKKNGYEEDIYVEFSELDSFYEVETKYYIKLKYNLWHSLELQPTYYNKSLTGGQDLFWSKRQGAVYQTQFTVFEIMKLPKEIQNGLNGGLLELEDLIIMIFPLLIIGIMFIVGIETPEGQYSYHYHIDKYWDVYNVKELEYAPEWDGHKPEDITRLLSLLK